ncbi:MAG: MGMT family protein, partial [Atribacterota bacterium]|nr:MGMT family protein [Atribacterota bacterium]
IETSFGISIVSWQEDKLVSFTLPQRKRETTFLRFAQQCQLFSVSPYEEKNDPFALEGLIQKYFEGQVVSFLSYPFALEIYPPFTRKVLQATALIPYGNTRTYGEIARAIGIPRACRAVGQSLGKNLLPLLIPCHRVIAQNSLGGFGEGLRMKVLLLSIEFSNLTSYFLSQGAFQEDANPLIQYKRHSSIDGTL